MVARTRAQSSFDWSIADPEGSGLNLLNHSCNCIIKIEMNKIKESKKRHLMGNICSPVQKPFSNHLLVVICCLS